MKVIDLNKERNKKHNKDVDILRNFINELHSNIIEEEANDNICNIDKRR